MPEADANFTPYVFDGTHLNMKFSIPRYVDVPDFYKVTKCLRYKDGLPIDRDQNNPILDTIMYEVEYKYSNKALMSSNAIAEKFFTQVDGE